MWWRVLEYAFAASGILFGAYAAWLLWQGPKKVKAHSQLEKANEEADVAQTENKTRRTKEWADALKDKPLKQEKPHNA